MKQAFHKTSIPPTQMFVVKRLQEKHFDPLWHSHPEYQLFLVLKGSGTRFIGDNIKRFEPGELIFTGPHLPHLWRSDDAYFARKSDLQTDGIVLYLNENFLGNQMQDKEELIALKKLFSRSDRGLEFYGKSKEQVSSMLLSLPNLQGIPSIIKLLEIVQILATTKQYHFISSVVYQDVVNEQETDRINLVYEYVMKNFRQKITLQEIASLVHMTPTSFSRYFTMKNNRPFSSFISEIRIKHACKLIAETELTMEHICYESGFNTLSNFNRQFKEIVGQQPTVYKKEIKSI
ncbi:MAG: AraC family transcriptional regulator [Flavihumibacter sp.]|nr:AraC family transcriptional regulator [Flavihumibacter sp.]